MAPRGGRGGFHSSGGGSGSIQCSGDAFENTDVLIYFVNTVLFFVLFGLLFLIAPGFRKKCGNGKQLIGAAYLTALFFTTLGYLLNLIATVIQECNSANGPDTYLSLLIACYIFLNLGYWLLIFVYIYTLNVMLRERLGGSALIYKGICIAMVGLLFALFCADIGLQSYDLWTQTEEGFDSEPLYHPEFQLGTAMNVLIFIFSLASGGLAIFTLISLRSKQHPAHGLIVWVCALFFCVVIVAILSIVFSATALKALEDPYGSSGLTVVTQEALVYIQAFFMWFSYIILLLIAKHVGWDSSAAAPTTPYVAPTQNQQTQYIPPLQQQQQPQYAYNQAPQQQYYQQQAPVYHNQPGYVK